MNATDEQPTISDRPLRVAVVGSGFSALKIHRPLIDAIATLDLTALVVRSADRRRQLAADLPNVATVGSIADLGSDTDIVVIATTDNTHHTLATDALNAGFHTVVDKPLATTSQQAYRLIGLAERQGRLLVPFQCRRFDSDQLTVQHLLKQGELGNVHRFETSITRWSPDPGNTWRDAAAPGELDGLLAGLGSHLVDQAISLFGPVSHVYAEIDTRRKGATVNDDDVLMLRHTSGVRTRLVITALSALPQPRMRLDGARGAYECFGLDSQQDSLTAGQLPGSPGWGVDAGRISRIAIDGETANYPLHHGDWRILYQQLRASLDFGGRSPINPYEVAHGLAVLEAARRSADTYKTVTVDTPGFSLIPID